MKPWVERIYNGVVKENPTMVLMLGMCPTLAVTTSAVNALGMGVSTMVVLIMSNLVISLVRNIIPDKVRLPAFIVIVASLVTMVELLMEAFVPGLYQALGIYIPLIVVNCIILGRAEAYASKNPPLLSVMDGLGMGLGFTCSLFVIGVLREFLCNGTVFGLDATFGGAYKPMVIFVKAPGAFLILAFLIAILNACHVKNRSDKLVESGCDGHCAGCGCPCGEKKEEVKK